MSFKRSRLNCWGYLTALTRACMIITVHLRRYRYRVVSQNVRVRSDWHPVPAAISGLGQRRSYAYRCSHRYCGSLDTVRCRGGATLRIGDAKGIGYQTDHRRATAGLCGGDRGRAGPSGPEGGQRRLSRGRALHPDHHAADRDGVESERAGRRDCEPGRCGRRVLPGRLPRPGEVEEGPGRLDRVGHRDGAVRCDGGRCRVAGRLLLLLGVLRAGQDRQILGKLLDGSLRLTPHLDQTPASYEFEGTGTSTGLLSGVVAQNVAPKRSELEPSSGVAERDGWAEDNHPNDRLKLELFGISARYTQPLVPVGIGIK